MYHPCQYTIHTSVSSIPVYHPYQCISHNIVSPIRVYNPYQCNTIPVYYTYHCITHTSVLSTLVYHTYCCTIHTSVSPHYITYISASSIPVYNPYKCIICSSVSIIQSHVYHPYQCIIVLCFLHFQTESFLSLTPFLLNVPRPVEECVLVAVIEVLILPILPLLLPTLCKSMGPSTFLKVKQVMVLGQCMYISY